MKKFLIIITTFFLFVNNISFAGSTGKGELKFGYDTMVNAMMYFYGTHNPKWSDGANKKNHPMIMTVSENGKSSMYYYCPYPQGCEDGQLIYDAIKACEKYSNGSPCKVWARKRSIIWKNDQYEKRTSVKKSFLKDPYKVAKLIQDLGFYDGDINELPGIDPKTAQIIEDEEIKPKKKKTKITETVETNSNNISDDTIEKLKSLKELFDTGVLTEEEFTKAKKKLLNL
tara:strand:- start:203 stop:886 length:684 start_codon:yes stop_codon:yes gene_type:complete